MDDLEGRRSRRRGISQVIGENSSDQPCSSNHLPNYQGGESSMDVHDWRTQFLPDSRERIVNKIMGTLERHLPHSGPEGFNELWRIAIGFEDKIFFSATSQSDYLHKISLELFTMESKNQAVNQEATPDCVPFNKVEEVIKESDSQFNSSNHLPTSQAEHPSIDAIDWKNQLRPGSRQRILNKIMETLERHLPFSGPEGRAELKKIAGGFEEKIFSAAVNQSDYLRRISLRMLSMESKNQGLNQNLTTDSVPNNNYSEPMFSNDTPTSQAEHPSIDAIDWKNQLRPGSRQRIVNKIMETLERHLSFSGPEGRAELKKIAGGFEEKIFSAAVNQSDYLRRISLKMLSMESKNQGLNQNLTTDSVPNNNYSEPMFSNDTPTSQAEHPSIDAIDWKNQLRPGSRQRIVNKIMETLERHLPFSGPEGRAELKKIAGRFEEKIFSAAVNQSDYLRRISLKMLSMESKTQGLNQNVTTDSVPNNNYSEPMFSNDTPTPHDWRTEVLPDSRETIVNNIRDTLAMNLPFYGPEGSKEVKRMAIRFEKKIFSSASSQSDYLHIISSKMLSLSQKCENA